jgi:hypothetical protein
MTRPDPQALARYAMEHAGEPHDAETRAMRPYLIPGRNVDRVDVAAGMRELTACGFTEPRTRMVVEYALARWARGEEEAAERGAIDPTFHGIDLTSWRRVLAAALASAAAA